MILKRFPGLLLLLLALSAPPAESAPAPAEKPAAGLAGRRLEFALNDRVGFVKKAPPRPGEWLSRFEEKGRSFRNYVADRPVRAAKGQHLAFLPIGPFDAHERRILDRSVDFARIWFALEAKTLPGIALPEGEPSRMQGDRPQYLTGIFLRGVLPRRRPEKAVCLFGVTMSDLYPGPNWNYVFGQASIRGKVGIWSFIRYFEEFWGGKDTVLTRRMALRRACRLVVHEAGHTFGMLHCIKDECTMNGSNSLDESDGQPLHLCLECLKKLTWNRGFDVLKRYDALAACCEKFELKPEAKWFRARAARIRAVK